MSEKFQGSEEALLIDTELDTVRAQLEAMGLIIVDEEPSTVSPTDRPDRVLVVSGGALRHGKTAALVAALAESKAVDVQVYARAGDGNMILTAEVLDELIATRQRRAAWVVPKGTALHAELQREREERQALGPTPTYQGAEPNRKQRRASASRARKGRA